MSLKCRAVGGDNLVYRWTHNNNTIIPTSHYIVKESDLIIVNATTFDTGQYQCIVIANSGESVASKYAVVIVAKKGEFDAMYAYLLIVRYLFYSASPSNHFSSN